MLTDERRDAVDSEATCPSPPRRPLMVAYLCSFSSGLDEIPKRRVCRASVLAVLDKKRRFSDFEVTATIAPVLDDIIKSGLILTDLSDGYPWIRVELTEAGRRELRGATDADE